MLQDGSVSDDVVFGRMSTGLDPNDFDYLPPLIVNMTPENIAPTDIFAGDVDLRRSRRDPFADEGEERLDLSHGEGEFASPPVADSGQFPVLRGALRQAQAQAEQPLVVRVDDEDSYGQFMGEATVREIDRRLRELRAFVEQHAADHHGAPVPPLRTWDAIGAAQAVSDLQSATSALEASRKFPAVEVGLPDYAQGAVRCWRDGGHVVCSIDFETATGDVRTATSAAPMSAAVDEMAGWALQRGGDAVTILGALPQLAASATGKRLVRDVARAAQTASNRMDVCGMVRGAGPVIVIHGLAGGSPPLTALMNLEEKCQAGDAQACREMAMIEAAAATPMGQKVAAPLLSEARRRVAAQALAGEVKKPSFWKRLGQSYAQAAGWR